MKYKLKKDLPFAKAGEPVRYFYGSTRLTIAYNPFPNEGIDLHLCKEDTIKELIKDGWIEEVKPREWFIVKNKFGETIQVMERRSEDLIVNGDEVVIKVREVIE